MFMRDGQGTDEGLGSNTQGAPTIGEASTSYARSRDQGRGMRDCRAATSAENQIQMGRRLTRLTPSAAIHRVAKEETRGWGPNIDFTRPLRHCPQFRAGNLQLHVLLVKLSNLSKHLDLYTPELLLSEKPKLSVTDLLKGNVLDDD